MTLDDHLDYLSLLRLDYGKGFMTAPKVEGCFYFGEGITFDEYVEKYEEQCNKMKEKTK